MKKIALAVLFFIAALSHSSAQTLNYAGKEFDPINVKASVVKFKGEKVLKVERDLSKLPFEVKNLSATVDEPTFVKLKGLKLDSGIIEVKVLSRIQQPSPFAQAQGFIGIAFMIDDNNTTFQSIYLRPNVGRSENQLARNHTVQYFAYPDYKFDKLRLPEYKGQYETYANIGLDEWITMRIEFAGKVAKLYLNNQKYPSFIVNEMKGTTSSGSIALWVDIGTEGYFKDLKVTQKK